MSELIKMTKLKVTCDNESCNWEQEIPQDALKLWHNVNCPVCGKGPIIDDTDLALFKISGELALAQMLQQVGDISNLQEGLSTIVKSKDYKE